MDNCVCCPLGKVVDIFNFKRGKTKAKTSWVECGASRVEEKGEGVGQRALLFFSLHIIKELSCSIRQMIGIYHESPDYKC